jgi:hypothetical protein
LLGGVKFELSTKAEFTQREADLVRRYRADKEVLVQREVKILLTDRTLSLELTIGSLTSGSEI